MNIAEAYFVHQNMSFVRQLRPRDIDNLLLPAENGLAFFPREKWITPRN